MNHKHSVSLLEEYQYDDEQTTDLLAAIRQWNLTPRWSDSVTAAEEEEENERHSHDKKTNDNNTKMNLTQPSSSYPCPSDPVPESSLSLSNSHSFSMTENDTNTLTSSTFSSAKKAPPRTPTIKSNFSSRPSGITSRLLMLDDMNPNLPEKERDDDNTEQEKHKQNQNAAISELMAKTHDNYNDDDNTSEIIIPNYHWNRMETMDISHHNMIQKKKDDEEDENNKHHQMLLDTAKQLGLKEDQLHLILPTVKKLVQVVTQHVPHLESFVEKVTETVLHPSELSTCACTDSTNTTPKRKHHVKKRNMSTRREEMNQALTILTKHPEKYNYSQALTTSNDSSFKQRVKHQLFPNLIRSRSVIETPIKTNSSRTPIPTAMNQLATDDDNIIAEITRLVEFEEKYRKVHGIYVSEDKSGNEDTILQDLLTADRTALRRFVLHFAYLFSVKQEDVVQKMNDLYVFSHEATALIDDLKKAFNMPESCPIHSVARRILMELKHVKHDS